MSTPVGLGVPIPKMLPITGTWTLPLAAYMVLLSNRVVMARINSKKLLGDNTGKSSSEGSVDELQVNSRCHANFLENVPIAVLLCAVAELNGGNKKSLNLTMAALFVARILHAEFGLRGPNANGPGRAIGYSISTSILAGLSAYSAYLVKGYWGF